MKAKRPSKSPEEINAALAAKKGPVSKFIAKNYRHFNAAALLDAAKGYETHLAAGGKMLMTIAGAMSTAELGISLAEMIRRDKVHLIVCTGANLEEDIFNLVAHDHYERVPHYRQLTPQDEQQLLARHMNRVTDTCIPEMEAMRRIEKAVLEEWIAADRAGERYFPHEFMYKILRSGKLKKSYQIDPKNSWMVAACEKNLPIVVPGWEDATLGNMYAAAVIRGDVEERAHGAHRHRIHDLARGLLHEEREEAAQPRGLNRFFPDRRRHRRRFPDLRRPDAAPGSRAHRGAAVGLFLPNQRFDDELRQLLRRRAERENHLGQARGLNSEVRGRKRCHDLRAFDLRLGARAVRIRQAAVALPLIAGHAYRKALEESSREASGESNALCRVFDLERVSDRGYCYDAANSRNAFSDIWNSCQSGSIFAPSCS